MEATAEEMLRCSFCGLPQKAVVKFIAGGGRFPARPELGLPETQAPRVYICDGCIRLCVEIIDDERK
jgi:hypothetical protein